MNKTSFILTIHNHQPVGNFGYVIEDAYSKAYLPFLKTLERHQDIKAVLHYCGILYSFFEEKHPEFLDILASLVKRGQVEILTGGFYEPILPVLPEVDGLGQIKKMTDFIRRRLDYDPKGMWIAERVWEPCLPTLLAKAGVCYTTLDDFHFRLSGLRDESLNGYYTTDDGDGVVGIFPGNERLRYLIPFRLPEETIGFLSERTSKIKDNVVITIADDGEKFGIWPETYKSVYEEGWLERFFSTLEANKEWLETTTFSDYWNNNPPIGRVYLPTASYREMGEWALPPYAIREYEDVLGRLSDLVGAEKAKTLIRGGFWRNFLAKYPEANNIHKKMLYVSKKVHEAIDKSKVQSSNFRVKGSKKTSNSSPLIPEILLEELYMGQCNDAYWHGVFGGLYLPHLRTSVYEHLIKAEAIADSFLHKEKAWLDVEERDMDLDKHIEIQIETPLINLYIDPEEGGGIFEWDYRPKSFNIMNTFTRKEEGYHCKIEHAPKESSELKTIHGKMCVKEEGLDQFLCYDRYRRLSLLDHFMPLDTSLLNFKDGKYHEEGDFIYSPYNSSIIREGSSTIVSLTRGGKVNQNALNLEKTLVIKPDKPGTEIVYNLNYQKGLSSIFGVEFNLALSGKGEGRYLRISGFDTFESDIANPGAFASVRNMKFIDEWLGIALTLKTEPEMDLWHFPLETVSQSEGGFERVYQHSVFFPHWDLNKHPGSSKWRGRLILSVEELKP